MGMLSMRISELEKDKALLTFLSLFLYFLVRIPAFPCNPHGDEAWYYYISKNLLWNWDPHLPFLPPIRWAFMLIMHPFTQNIWTFRVAYVLLNSITIIAFYRSSRKLLAPFIASLALIFNPVHIFYSTRVITSTLSSTFMVLSLMSIDNLSVSLLFAILSVGSWEGALFPYLAIALVYGIKKKRYLLFLIPAALALATSYDNALLGARLPGWTKGGLNAIQMVLLFLLPAGAFLCLYQILRGSLGDALIAYSEALGMVANNLLRGVLIEVWYTLPSQVLLLYYMSKLDLDTEDVKHLKLNKNGIIKLICLMALISSMLYVLLGLKFSYSLLYLKKDCCHLTISDFLKVERSKVVLYKVFWAYRDFPYDPHRSFNCYTMECLRSHIRTSLYVVSSVDLHISALRELYHEGECYLYRVIRR